MERIHKEADSKITRFLERRFGTWLVHWHKEVEIVHILEEPAPFLVGNECFTAKTGDFVIAKGCEPHQFRFDRNNKKLVQICKFNIGLMYDLTKSFKYPKTHITKSEIDAVPGLYGKLCEAFEELGKHADGKGSDVIADCYTLLLYSLLTENFPTDTEFSSYDSESLMNLQKLLDYIDQNYSKSISLHTLTEVINYSPNYISSLFRKYGNMSYKEYLDNVRISHAAEIIRKKSQNKNFTEVAAVCGFDNIRTFNNVFKRIMGCTPSEYKNAQI